MSGCRINNNPSGSERGMPGPFPGRVIEVKHTGSVVDNKVLRGPVHDMIAAGMSFLTSSDDSVTAWRSMFERGDIVGIKVNSVGRPLAISNYAVIHEIIDGLKSVGVRPADIIVFDRHETNWAEAKYEENLPDNIQKETATDSLNQLEIKGFDPDVYVHMEVIDFINCDPKDDRTRRSHLSTIVSKKINKLINVPVLKDHIASGITGALKNLSHGLVNNVRRSHCTPETNICGMFIPTICALQPIREKTVLNIMDGLIGVYQNGPHAQIDSPYTWPYRSLLFSTDPVAMDRIEWDIIDAKRMSMNLFPVAKAGQVGVNESGEEAISLRQPNHVIIVGGLGLGIADLETINLRKISLA